MIKENDLQKTPDAYCVGSFLPRGNDRPAAFAERGIWVSCALLAVSFLIMFIREEEVK